MSISERKFRAAVAARQAACPSLRYGQTCWNVASAEFGPEQITELAQTDLDPFYHDNRTEAFIGALYRLGLLA